MTKKYLVRTYGCQMNEHDSERISGLLAADGMEPTDSADDADVIVLNTCCIRENADDRLYSHLGNLKPLKAARPDLQIMVGGCLAQKDRDLIREKAGHVDVVFGTHNVHRAVELMHESRASGPIVEILEAAVIANDAAFPSALPAQRELQHAAWVTIQIGCDNSCAFCIVPAVRGEEISRSFADILAEVAALASAGVSEITLLGQNVNSYGRDLTLGVRQASGEGRIKTLFSELLVAVGAIDGIRRIRYTSPHPKDFRADTIAAMATTAAVCEHLHLPLQSGSDAILSAMHRGYTGARYLDKITAARAAIDDLAVSTDIIVGFPGETERDFSATLEIAAAAEFDSVYEFIYSPRPGTEAAELVDKFVDQAVVAERFKRLHVVVERTALAKHRERIGRVEEVVVEGPSKKDPAVTTGRTRQNKLTHFRTDRPLRPGTYCSVEITSSGPHHLMADMIEVVALPTHKTKIPVVVG